MYLGINRQVILLTVLSILPALSGAQTVKSYKYQLNGNLETNIAVTKNQSFVINYSATELTIENIENPNGIFYRISIPGHFTGSKPGKPELPVYSRLIEIPEGSEYNVKITDVRSSRIKPSGKKIDGRLFPAQEGETKELQQKKPVFLLDKELYASRGIIYTDTVTIEPLGKVRNKSLANLVISPVRYNPHLNTLEVITSMKIEISFSSVKGIESKSADLTSELFNESLSKSVINYNPTNVVPGFRDQPVKMIILTDTAFKKQLAPFIKWKTQKGFKLQVLYRGVGLAGDTYLQLKDTLTKMYHSATEADPPADYLLIIGDINRVPYYGTGTTGNITDMYYGEFDGNGDYIPEMYVGRLPVSDTTELKSVIKKIIQYEKFQFAGTNNFYSGAIAAAGSDAGYATYMNGQLRYAVSNYLIPQNRISEQHFYYYPALSGIQGISLLSARKDSLINIINKGTSFINYTGHGDLTGWLHLNIKVADTSKFKNENMYPFIISNACRTAQYDTKYSFGNRMVISDKKGAIGFIGCSNDSYWDEDYYWSVGTGPITVNPTYAGSGLGAMDRLFHTHSESPSEWYYTMGQINYAGNLSVSASTSSRKKYYWETYNVIGDPSIIPIIGKPLTFNVSIPDTLPNGITSLSLNLEPFSYIAVSHFDKLWDATFASASGSAVLYMPGLSNDSCLVVITGQNRYPIIKTIYFADINKEFLNLAKSVVNDIQGNNNLRADFGETFFLKTTISNLGLKSADSVYAKISTLSPWLKINSDSAFIGTLLAKSQVVLADKLEISIIGNVPDMSVATVNLVLKDTKTEKHYAVDIAIHSPDLLIVSCTLDDSILGNGDFIADPGESFNLVFRILNHGSSDVSGQLNIASQSGEINVLEPAKNSGILKYGITTSIPILVKLSETVPSGTIIPVSSKLDCNPFIVNKDFSFRVGRIRESFESSSFNIFPWLNVSPIPWTVTGTSSQDGTIAARSGAISHYGSTSLIIRTVYATADSIKFYYKVSSEINYDNFYFILNGTEVLKKSGDIPWTRVAIAVPAGLNKMEWRYNKDASVSDPVDCVFIDMIDFAVNGVVNYIQKDLYVAKVVEPVQKDRYGKEIITVKVLNTGKDIINGFNLAYSINDKMPPVTQFFDNIINPNSDTVTVSFKDAADLSKYGIYKITSYGFDNRDDYINNDTALVSIEYKLVFETLRIFPNPFKDQITIYFNSELSEKLRISISNVNGVKLYSTEKDVLNGKNVIIITDTNLLPSVYYLNIRGSTFNKTIPIIKID